MSPGSADLVGRRYQLTPLSDAHVTERYVGWVNDPQINRFLQVRFTPQTLDTVRAYVRSFYGEVERYAWAIVDGTGSGEMVGTCSLYDISRQHGSAYFGMMIGDQRHWGTGCSSEAVDLLLSYAFDVLRLRRVSANNNSANRAMTFAFKKLAFTREGTVRQAYCLEPGRYYDCYYWGILAEEWRARRVCQKGHA